MQPFSIIAIIVLYFASMALVPWVITHLPSDYFSKEERKKHFFKNSSHFIRNAFIILKNIIGLILVLAGVSMLFLPGQGVLTIVAGIIFMDFPYKYKIEKLIIRQPIVLQMFNKIREKAHKASFVV